MLSHILVLASDINPASLDGELRPRDCNLCRINVLLIWSVRMRLRREVVENISIKVIGKEKD